MGKAALVLLIAILTLITAVVGGNQPLAASERGDMTYTISNESPQPSKILRSIVFSPNTSVVPLFRRVVLIPREPVTISSIKDSPLTGKLITAFLLGQNQQPFWMRVVENKGQGLTFNRVQPATKAGTTIVHKFAWQDKKLDFLRSVSFSKNLMESSPPGYFLLI